MKKASELLAESAGPFDEACMSSELLSGWISTAERMPECESTSVNSGRKFTVVMVYHAGGHDIASYYEDTGFTITGIKDGSRVAEELHDLKVETITHWMRLPEPPAR